MSVFEQGLLRVLSHELVSCLYPLGLNITAKIDHDSGAISQWGRLWSTRTDKKDTNACKPDGCEKRSQRAPHNPVASMLYHFLDYYRPRPAYE